MQTIDEVKRHCRVVGEGIAAAVAEGEDLGKRFEGVQYWCCQNRSDRNCQNDKMMKTVFVFAAAVLVAAVCGAAEPVVKELFPWFEIGETVDAAKEKAKGLCLLHSYGASGGLRARAEYVIEDRALPTNDMAWVVLSVPDRKVLQMQRDIGCGTTEAARKLALELHAKFKTVESKDGPKLIEIMKVVDPRVSVQLSDAAFGKELNDWLKRGD